MIESFGPIHLGCKNIAFSADGKSIVTDINFDVEGPQIMAVIGPNGSGKTTLLKMIAGLMTPTAGQVYINQQSLGDMTAQERSRKIAVVNQNSQVDERILLQQYVTLGRLPHENYESSAQSLRLAQEAMKLTGIETFARRPFGKLSGGERQRAHIARAVCQAPDILILDEPTNHLDPEAKGSILSMVKGLGIMVVAALHDIDLVMAFADRTVILSQGMVAASGPSHEVLTTEKIRSVFKVDMLRFKHPLEDRDICHLDVKLVHEEDLIVPPLTSERGVQ